MRVELPTINRILSLFSKLIPPIFYPSLRSILIQSLKCGPLPKHIGFIMDGNRRFSRFLGLPVEEGHAAGFEALKRILELLLRLEVPNVTVYAFAIDNFKRPPDEVNKLMSLARAKLVQICEKGEILDRYGIRVVVIGRKDLLPADVQESVYRVERMTAQNNRGCLNVAFPYSSQEEMATAICKTAQDTTNAQKPASTIEIETIDSNLYTSHSPPLDIVVRTSGVSRLSDFLLWQSTLNTIKGGCMSEGGPPDPMMVDLLSSQGPKGSLNRQAIAGPSIHFIPKFWPDFGLLDILPILLGWQAEAIFLHLLHLFSFN